MDYREYKKRKTEEDLRREIMELRKKVNALEENRSRSEAVHDTESDKIGTDNSIAAENDKIGTDNSMAAESDKIVTDDRMAAENNKILTNTGETSEDIAGSSGDAVNENPEKVLPEDVQSAGSDADTKISSGPDSGHTDTESNSRRREYDEYDVDQGNSKYYDNEDDEDDDEDDEDDEESGRGKLTAGDLVFRILTGLLVFAICITAVTAVLLATGRLNGVIDSLGNENSEAVVTESSEEVTPTVRVTLTPTPTPSPEATETPTPKPKATEAPSPTTAPDSSTASGTESIAEGAAVMTFKDVDDVVTAKETTNLRNVPSQGEESFIVYILQNGETLKRTGISDDGWSRLEYEGQVVYAMSNLLTTDLTKKEESGGTESGAAGDAEIQIQTVFTDVNEQVTPKIEVNLRKLPSVTNPNATVIATVKNGEVFTRTGVNEELGWSRVEYNGQTLYCISSYVETVTPTA